MKLTFTIILLMVSVLSISPGEATGVKGHKAVATAEAMPEGECSDPRFKAAELAAYRALLQARAAAAQVVKDAISALEEGYKKELKDSAATYQSELKKCGNTDCTQARAANDKQVADAQVGYDEGLFVARGKEQTANEEAQEKYDQEVEKARQLFCKCSGQWQGTITYTYIFTTRTQQSISPPRSARHGEGSLGSHSDQDLTTTHSGTVRVDGTEWLANSFVDEISIINGSASFLEYCHGGLGGPVGALVVLGSHSSQIGYGSGNSQGTLPAGLSLDKDGYQVRIRPLAIIGTYQFSTTNTLNGGCPNEKPASSFSLPPTKKQYGVNDYIVGKAAYKADRNILSGTDTSTRLIPLHSETGGDKVATTTTTGNIKTIATITWRLRRCK